VTEQDVYDITIVGGSPSGLYAAFYAVGDIVACEGKFKLIAAAAEAAVAVNYARNYLDPTAKVFPGHSSDRDGESP